MIPWQCDAWIVVIGSSGSLATTIPFVYVLVKFPGFLRHIKSEGAEAAIVVQLHTFYRLNVKLSRPSHPSSLTGSHRLLDSFSERFSAYQC